MVPRNVSHARQTTSHFSCLLTWTVILSLLPAPVAKPECRPAGPTPPASGRPPRPPLPAAEIVQWHDLVLHAQGRQVHRQLPEVSDGYLGDVRALHQGGHL